MSELELLLKETQGSTAPQPDEGTPPDPNSELGKLLAETGIEQKAEARPSTWTEKAQDFGKGIVRGAAGLAEGVYDFFGGTPAEIPPGADEATVRRIIAENEARRQYLEQTDTFKAPARELVGEYSGKNPYTQAAGEAAGESVLPGALAKMAGLPITSILRNEFYPNIAASLGVKLTEEELGADGGWSAVAGALGGVLAGEVVASPLTLMYKALVGARPDDPVARELYKKLLGYADEKEALAGLKQAETAFVSGMRTPEGQQAARSMAPTTAQLEKDRGGLGALSVAMEGLEGAGTAGARRREILEGQKQAVFDALEHLIKTDPRLLDQPAGAQLRALLQKTDDELKTVFDQRYRLYDQKGYKVPVKETAGLVEEAIRSMPKNKFREDVPEVLDKFLSVANRSKDGGMFLNIPDIRGFLADMAAWRRDNPFDGTFTPMIKKVEDHLLDRLDQAARAPDVQDVDRASLQALNKQYRQYLTTFRDGPIGTTLHRTAMGGHYATPDTAALTAVLGAGEQPKAWRQFLDAVGATGQNARIGEAKNLAQRYVGNNITEALKLDARQPSPAGLRRFVNDNLGLLGEVYGKRHIGVMRDIADLLDEAIDLVRPAAKRGYDTQQARQAVREEFTGEKLRSLRGGAFSLRYPVASLIITRITPHLLDKSNQKSMTFLTDMLTDPQLAKDVLGAGGKNDALALYRKYGKTYPILQEILADDEEVPAETTIMRRDGGLLRLETKVKRLPPALALGWWND